MECGPDDPEAARGDPSMKVVPYYADTPLFGVQANDGTLAVKIAILEQDMERFSEGMQGLVGEAEGVIGGMMERISILHARTSRIEGMLGLPPFGEGEEEPENADDETKEATDHLDEVAEEPDGAGAEDETRQAVDEDPSREAEAESRRTDSPPPCSESEDVTRTWEPNTPSTDIPTDGPGDDDVSSAQEYAEQFKNVDDRFRGMQDEKSRRNMGKPPRGADFPGSMKDRLSALEVEIQALASRLQQSQPPVEASIDPASLEEKFNELSAWVCRRDAACGDFQQALEAESQSLRAEFVGKIDGANRRMGIQFETLSQKVDTAVVTSEECQGAVERTRSQVDALAQRVLGAVAASSEAQEYNAAVVRLGTDVQGLASRVSGLEAELPRGRVRASSRGPGRFSEENAGEHSAGGGQTAVSTGVIDGLAQGVAAIARAMGLMTDGEMLGQGPDGWSLVGRKMDKAWAARLKEFWQLGLPARPHLFDILRSQANGMALPAAAAAAAAMPDRREGVRLATRLAAAVAFGSATAGEEQASEPPAGSHPKVRRSSSMTAPVRAASEADAWGDHGRPPRMRR